MEDCVEKDDRRRKNANNRMDRLMEDDDKSDNDDADTSVGFILAFVTLPSSKGSVDRCNKENKMKL